MIKVCFFLNLIFGFATHLALADDTVQFSIEAQVNDGDTQSEVILCQVRSECTFNKNDLILKFTPTRRESGYAVKARLYQQEPGKKKPTVVVTGLELLVRDELPAEAYSRTYGKVDYRLRLTLH